MKNYTIKSTVIGMAMCIIGYSGFAQGFVNLDFESANITPIVTGGVFVASTNALPGWTVYDGSSQQTEMTVNDPSTGLTSVSLWATNGSQISGNFSVILVGGFTASGATISQTGLVPVSADSLLFEAQAGLGGFTVTLGGQNIPFFALATGANYTLYGGDISAFAGQTQQLTFSALQDFNALNFWNLDNIQFSSSPVPEPGALGSSALCGLFLAWRRWKK